MQRREFLGTAAGAALVGRAGPGGPGGPARSGPPLTAWAWVHGAARRTPDDWGGQFARLAGAGFRGVLVGGGDTAVLADAARSAGLAFHRWTWVLNRSGDAWVKTNHPEWFTVSRYGDSSLTSPPYVPYYQWLCPTRPAVRDYLRDVVAAIAADPAVDGVHFDYIRHCDVILPEALWPRYNLIQDTELPEFDFCYCEVCRATFRARHGRDPLDLPDPPADRAWREFRWDSVTGLVRVLAAAVRAAGKPATAAVFPSPSIARRLVRQAWDRWGLDTVFPMLYQGFYNEDLAWIARATREGVRALPRTTPLVAGLYLPDLTPDQLAEAVRQARAGGAQGISLFEMDGISDAHVEALRAAMGDG